MMMRAYLHYTSKIISSAQYRHRLTATAAGAKRAVTAPAVAEDKSDHNSEQKKEKKKSKHKKMTKTNT